MVEATIALPVLIVLLIGATYLRELYIARAGVRLAARSCAWAYALDGCNGSRPAQCATSPSLDSAYRENEAMPDIATHVRAGNGDNPLRGVPVVSDALDALFGQSTHATSDTTVPFPFDAKRVGVAHAENVVVCNSVPTEVLDIAEDLLCEHLGC